MNLKKYFFAILLLLSTVITAQTKLYTEQYRPQFHFSPSTNWCNDPNGLVYYKGVYHLFYQHNPFGNVWGHMSWGHATSKDLIHWKHLPIAIPEENGVMIFSGTCVVDKNNTSGFGKDGKIPMVAVYTGHKENVNQSQHIAYSLDDGITWTKYANNPVLDLHKKDFRDPKIFWHQQKNYWVMAVMLPVEHMVQFYSSENLKEWKHLSDFGPAGDTSGVWECPDLTQVPIEGKPGQLKWLLQMSQNASMQYFVGEFDGITFTNENPTDKIYRPDYGPDYYAAISFNQLPSSVLPTAIGWINNWNYANDLPTTAWKGAMSLPRTLSVKKINGEWILIQKPVKNLYKQKMKKLFIKNLQVSGTYTLPVKSKQFTLYFEVTPGEAHSCGAKIKFGNEEFLEIGYDSLLQQFFTRRNNCSSNITSKDINKLSSFTAPSFTKKKRITFDIYFDNSIVEVFINGGESVFSIQAFPLQTVAEIELYNTNYRTQFFNLLFNEVKAVW